MIENCYLNIRSEAYINQPIKTLYTWSPRHSRIFCVLKSLVRYTLSSYRPRQGRDTCSLSYSFGGWRSCTNNMGVGYYSQWTSSFNMLKYYFRCIAANLTIPCSLRHHYDAGWECRTHEHYIPAQQSREYWAHLHVVSHPSSAKEYLRKSWF